MSPTCAIANVADQSKWGQLCFACLSEASKGPRTGQGRRTHRTRRLDEGVPLELVPEAAEEHRVELALAHLELDVLERERKVVGRARLDVTGEDVAAAKRASGREGVSSEGEGGMRREGAGSREPHWVMSLMAKEASGGSARRLGWVEELARSPGRKREGCVGLRGEARDEVGFRSG